MTLTCMLLITLLQATQPAARVVLPDESHLQPGPGDGSGRVTVEPQQIPVGSPCTLTFRYTATEPLQVGGGVACLVSAFWGWGPPQIEHPALPGYVTVRCDQPNVELATEVHQASRAIYIKVQRGPLLPGSVITLVYGDTSNNEHPQAVGRSDAYAEREERFFFRVDGDGDGFYVPIRRQVQLALIARPATQLVCNGPGHAYVGAPLEVSVAALDAGGNRDEQFRGKLLLAVSGADCDGPSEVAFEAAHRGAQRVRLQPRSSGIVLVEVRDPDGNLPTTTSNPILVREAGEARRLYWGDLHGHTNRSDGTGTPSDYFAYARDVARLDVVALTDHDRWGYAPLRDDPDTWQNILQASRTANEPGRFLTLPGYEWTNWTWGHMHVLFASESDATIIAWNEPGGETPAALWKSLAGREALTIPHHPGGSTMPFHWATTIDPHFAPLAEICSVHGVSESLDNIARVTQPVASGMLQQALARGHRLGLIGSGDSHDGHPGLRRSGGGAGLVGIYARDLTRAAIFEALRERRVYATTGCRAVLRFQVGGHRMGSENRWANPASARDVRISIFGDDALEQVELLRNNEVIARHPGGSAFVNWAWRDEAPLPPEGCYYYVRARQRDGHQIFSSPIWLTPKQPNDPG